MIDLTPLLRENAAIQIHVAFALPALVLGPIALFRRSRDRWHRLAGRSWVLSMAGLAASSLFIHEARLIGPFSPIHILSLVTFAGLWRGLILLRQRQFLAHGRAMRALYLQALILAGVFTFLPGRLMNDLMFPNRPATGLVVAILAGAALGFVLYAMPRLSGLNQRQTSDRAG